MEINKNIVKSIAEHLSDRPFDLEYWDGEIIKYGEGEPEFKLIIKNFPSKKVFSFNNIDIYMDM